MRILILGSDNLAAPLRQLGHEVNTCGGGADADLRVASVDPDWNDIVKILQYKGINPDAVLVNDDLGCRTLPTGLWACPAITVFYGIDSPMNRFWQQPYARLFDLVFMDQPDEAEDLASSHGQSHWLPVGVDFEFYQGSAPAKKIPGVCFVGVRNQRVRPKRAAILQKVAQYAPLQVGGGRQGEWLDTRQAAQLYRSHQVMLNENLFSGLTTRPLEGMASGVCVLSEAAPGAMDVFFKDGEHIAYFTPDNLAEQLKRCLSDNGFRRRLEQGGQEAVRQGHTLKHRAREMLRNIELIAESPPAKRRRARGGDAFRYEAEALLMAGVRWPKVNPLRLPRAMGRFNAVLKDAQESLKPWSLTALSAAVLKDWPLACQCLENANQNGSNIDVLHIALAYWQNEQPGRARQAVSRLNQSYVGLALGPGQAGFHLACARLLADAGADLTPGFNRQALPMLYWNALEHLVEATQLDAGLVPAWELTGDLLMKRRAPNQAHDCYSTALRIEPENQALGCKMSQAAHEGYLT